MFRSVVL
jgi:ATP synthase F1 complex assembly factor 2